MQTPNPFIVTPELTHEECHAVVVKISQSILTAKKVQEAFRRLFGTQLPHVQLERLIRMNARALTQEYNKELFSLLGSSSQSSFYQDSSFVENHQLQHSRNWKDGNLITRWERFTKKPNPHHILPESRGGSNNERNFWYVDRLTHNDFHTVFQNLTPSEQLIVLLNVHKRILSHSFTQELRNVLYDTYREPLYYRKGVMRKNHKEDGWSK